MVKPKLEKWGNRRIVVVREKGRIITWRRWSPKSFTLDRAETQFKRTGTFTDNARETREKLGRFGQTTEVARTFKSKTTIEDGNIIFGKLPKLPSKKDREYYQYVVELELKNGKKISASSPTIGRKSSIGARTNKEARDTAWQNVLGKLNQEVTKEGGSGNVDGGIMLFSKHVKNVREGWIIYRGAAVKNAERKGI